MHSQTYNKQSSETKTSFSNVVIVSIMGTLILIGGFMISMFLFALSAIIFPFAAFKLWRLQRQHQKNNASKDPSADDEGVIIEAEYVVVKEDKL